jgi:integrase
MARGGSIYPRPLRGGGVSFVVMWRDASGRQVKKTINGSRRDAERYLNSRLAGRDRGEHYAAGGVTFGAYASRWLTEHRVRVEHNTAVDYESTLRNHLLPYFAELKLRQVTSEHVRAYVAAKVDGSAPIRKQGSGRGTGKAGRVKMRPSAKTINNHVTLLRLIFGHAVSDGLIARNPVVGDRRRPLKLKVPHRESDYLRPDEVGMYLDAASAFWRPRAAAMILTGCRVGELLALERQDIDFAGGAVIFRRALKSGVVGSTKGDETGRRVDIGPGLVEILRDALARAAELDESGDDGLVFPAPDGGYDEPQRLLRYEHRPTLKRAGLRLSLVNHELRHTAAAVWLSLGYGLEYVRRQMGHTDIRTTIRNYGHFEPSLLPGAAAKTEAALGVTASLPRAGRDLAP